MNAKVAIKRKNLQASRCSTLGEAPYFVHANAKDEPSVLWALTPAMGLAGRDMKLDVQLRNRIVLSRLSLLPDAGDDVAEAVAMAVD